MPVLYVECPLCRGEGKPPWPVGRDTTDPAGVLSACSCGGRGFIPATAADVAAAAKVLIGRAYEDGRRDALASRAPIPEP